MNIADIDREESLNRQCRLGKKLNEDVVTSYALGMESPSAVWPMCILNKYKKSLFLWSGNHRVAAADLIGEKAIEAYVVNITDPKIQDIVPRLVNALESPIGQKREESLIHAQYMIENHNIEPKDAARFLNLRYDWIVQHMRGAEVAKKIQAQGVNPDGFAKNILMRLSPMASNANILRETTKFLKKNGVVGDEAIRFIDDVRRNGDTETEANREIKRWDDMIANRLAKKPSPFRSKTRTSFLKLLTTLHKLLDPIRKPSELQLEEGEEVKVAKYWFDVETKMNTLMNERSRR